MSQLPSLQATRNPTFWLTRYLEQLGSSPIFNVLRLYNYPLAKEKPLVVAAVVAQLASGVAQGFAVVMIVPMFNYALGQPNQFLDTINPIALKLGMNSSLGILVSLFILLGVLSSYLIQVANGTCDRLRLNVEGRLLNELLLAVSAVSWSGFTNLRLGEIGKTASTDGNYYAEGAEKLVHSFSMMLFSFVLLAIAFLTSPKTVWLVAPALGIGMVGFRWTRRRIGYRARLQGEATRVLVNTTSEFFNHWKFIKSTGMSERFLKHAQTQFRAFSRETSLLHSSNFKMHFLFESWSILIIGASLAFGFMTRSGNVGETIVVFGIFSRILTQLLGSQRSYDLAKARQYAAVAWRHQLEKVYSFAQHRTGKTKCQFAQAITLRKVGFTYEPGTNPSALQDISLHLPKGGCIAIVGSSGSGKTTLIDVVSGLLLPTEGTMLIDGIPIEDFEVESWQAQLGIVSQSTPLFFGTVLENIALGEGQPDIKRAELAAEMACANTFISEMREGYFTNVGEGGAKLSGGQRQRLAIARALYKRPELLILDEITSALDEANEAAIIETLKDLKGKLTMLIVTHKLQIGHIADQIIELEFGRVKAPAARMP